MKIWKLVAAAGFLTASLFAKTISLDEEGPIKVHLKNNSVNILKFPFVVYKAKLASKYKDDFHVEAKNSSIIILPSSESLNANGDLVVFSMKGNPYLIKIDVKGRDQVFDFVTNKNEKYLPMEARKFETGKIERDIKLLIKTVINKREIPGYKKIEVKRIFETPDLKLQKQVIFDGGKYRVEEWYVQNKTQDMITLDPENFYTNGILAIAFEKSDLNPGQIAKMWMIVNKSTIVERMRKAR